MMNALRVLVVEDNGMIGMLLAEMLEAMGHSVCAIETTEAAAVAAALRYTPDLVIVDVLLGDGCGVSAMEEIRRIGHVPHVFVTGDTARAKALAPDAVVMQKPFREADIARAIQRALGAATAAAAI